MGAGGRHQEPVMVCETGIWGASWLKIQLPQIFGAPSSVTEDRKTVIPLPELAGHEQQGSGQLPPQSPPRATLRRTSARLNEASRPP